MKFEFKQFSVQQNRSAMKIGTDSVLLGAWVTLEQNPESILDFGAGTGILSLQLAQRSFSEIIDAVELDEEAYEECVDNFEASDWGDRLFCYQASVQQFASEIEDTYDLIISNPPFYSDDYKSDDKARNTARFTDTLPFDELIAAVSQLLSEKGTFALILPKKEEKPFIKLAATFNLFPKRICRVKGSPSSEVKRSLLEFSFTKSEIALEELTIEVSRHIYTKEYKNLVKDFYLKM
jgi:tRNA1Val (adenine37-N6)-methyltransferase